MSRLWGWLALAAGAVAAFVAWLGRGNWDDTAAEDAADAALLAEREAHAERRAREQAEIERDLRATREANRKELDERLEDIRDDLGASVDDALREIDGGGDGAA